MENALFKRKWAFARLDNMWWHPWFCQRFHKAWTPVASSVLELGEDSHMPTLGATPLVLSAAVKLSAADLFGHHKHRKSPLASKKMK